MANGDSAQRARLHAIQCDCIPIRVAARPVKWTHPTGAAKQVHGCIGVESVLAEVAGSRENGQVGVWHNNVGVALDGADAARAVPCFHVFWGLKLLRWWVRWLRWMCWVDVLVEVNVLLLSMVVVNIIINGNNRLLHTHQRRTLSKNYPYK